MKSVSYEDDIALFRLFCFCADRNYNLRHTHLPIRRWGGRRLARHSPLLSLDVFYVRQLS